MCCSCTIFNISDINTVMADTPIRLKTQSQKVFGSFLYEQMALLVGIYQVPSIRIATFRSQYLEPLRRSLECYVLTNIKFSESSSSAKKSDTLIPCIDVASKFTKTILKLVLKSLYTLKQQFDGDERPSRVTADLLLMCEQVAGVVGAAFYHPSSTTLDLFKQYDFIPDSKIPKIFTATFLEKASSKMNNLTFLKLRCNLEDALFLPIVLKDMQNLRVFSYRNFCQDLTIFYLAIYCKHLTDLDVQGSKEVTDESISYILNFKNLKSLRMTGTGLSSEGITEIIIRLASSDNSLIDSSESPVKYEVENLAVKCKVENLEREGITTLGLDLTVSDIPMLRYKFMNLRSLQINLREHMCLSDLKLLFSVTELDLGIDMNSYQYFDTKFLELKELLVTLGPILYKLALREIFQNWNDLQYILKRCVHLQHLELEHSGQNLFPLSASMLESSVMGDNIIGSDILLRIIPLFGYIRHWKLSGLIWRSELLIVNVCDMAEREKLKRMRVNEYDMKFEGNIVNITSLFGLCFSVKVCDFKDILRNIMQNAKHLVILLTFLVDSLSV